MWKSDKLCIVLINKAENEFLEEWIRFRENFGFAVKKIVGKIFPRVRTP